MLWRVKEVASCRWPRDRNAAWSNFSGSPRLSLKQTSPSWWRVKSDRVGLIVEGSRARPLAASVPRVEPVAPRLRRVRSGGVAALRSTTRGKTSTISPCSEVRDRVPLTIHGFGTEDGEGLDLSGAQVAARRAQIVYANYRHIADDIKNALRWVRNVGPENMVRRMAVHLSRFLVDIERAIECLAGNSISIINGDLLRDFGSARRHREVRQIEALSASGDGAPGRIRTCDRRIRSPMLYPSELRGLYAHDVTRCTLRGGARVRSSLSDRLPGSDAPWWASRMRTIVP